MFSQVINQNLTWFILPVGVLIIGMDYRYKLFTRSWGTLQVKSWLLYFEWISEFFSKISEVDLNTLYILYSTNHETFLGDSSCMWPLRTYKGQQRPLCDKMMK